MGDLTFIIEELVPWLFKSINFKRYKELDSRLNVDQIDGNFRMSTFEDSESSWWFHDFEAEIPQIIGQYLRLNLTFIEPIWLIENITSKRVMLISIIQLMNDKNIDMFLEHRYLSGDILYPQVFAYSTGLFGQHQISILTRKEPVEKVVFGELNVFEPLVWLFLLLSMIAISIVGSIGPNVESSSRNSNLKRFFHLLFSILSLFLGQASVKIGQKVRKGALMYSLLILNIISLMSYKSILLDQVIVEPKEWCETIECFEKSNKTNLLGIGTNAGNAINTQLDKFKNLLSKTKKKHPTSLDMTDAFNIFEGYVNVIGDSSAMEKFKKLSEFSIKMDDWIITGRSDYALQVRMIRKKHPKSDRIRRKINDCLEFGIIDAVSKRTTQVSGIVYMALIERFFEGDDKMKKKWKYILSYKKTNISLEDFKSTFKLLVYGIIISSGVFVIEIIVIHFVDSILI